MLTPEQQSALSRLRGCVNRPRETSLEKQIREIISIFEGAEPHHYFPCLLVFLYELEKTQHPAVGEDLRMLIDKIPADKWSQVDQSLREELSILTDALYFQNAQPRKLTPDSPFYSLLGLCHPSGFIREKTLLSLGVVSSPEVIFIIILRCNDWVTPVRHAARDLLARIAPEMLQKYIAFVLTALDTLRQSSRFRDVQIQPIIDSALMSSRAAIEAALNTQKEQKSVQIRRAVSEFLIRHADSLTTTDLETFLRHGTPRELTLLVRKSRNFDPQRQVLVLDGVSRLKSVPLRRERLRLLAEVDPAENEDHFIGGLSDPSKSIRTICRFYLPHWNQDRLKSHYLRQLDQPLNHRQFRGNLKGLSEVDSGEAHQIAKETLSKNPPLPRTRVCIECLNFHHPDVLEEELLDWLASPILAISRTTTKEIISQKRLLQPSKLVELAELPALPCHSREHVLQILKHGAKWDVLPSLLCMTRSSDPKNHCAAVDLLHYWISDYGRSCITPTDLQVEAIRNEFLQSADYLPEHLRSELEVISLQIK